MNESKTGILMRYTIDRMQSIDLGKQGENHARAIEIDISPMLAKYPGANIQLLVKRNGDDVPYVANTEVRGDLLYWPITDVDTSFAGDGRIEIRALLGDTIAKSSMGTTRVSTSITGDASEPPAPAKDWLDKILEAGGNAQASAEQAKQAADRAEAAADAMYEQSVLDQIANHTYQGTDLTVKFSAEIAKYANPWEWIQARISAEDFSGIFVCDYIPFTTINNLTFQAQVAGINTYKGYGDTEVKPHIDFISRELWPDTFQMNKVNINNGTSKEKATPWLASNGYLFVNSLAGQIPNSTTKPFEMVDVDYTAGGMYYYLPGELKAVIVEKRVYAPTRQSDSGVLSNDNSGAWVNLGKLWLPDEYEITGARLMTSSGWFSGGFVQYPIFSHNMNRLKRIHGSNSRLSWWTSSAFAGIAASFVYVANLGHVNYYTASVAHRAPLCFRIS